MLRLAIVIEGIVLAAIVTAILAHAVWAARGDRALERRLRIGRPLLSALLKQPADDARTRIIRRLGRRVYIRLFAELEPPATDAEQDAVREVAARLGIVARAARTSRSRWWWRRLYATRLMTLVDGGAAFMPALVRDPHQLVRTQVAEWAALHSDSATLAALIGLLDDPTGIARFAVMDTLLRIGPLAAPALLIGLSTAGPAAIASLLLVGARLAEPILLPAGLSYATHHDAAVRAAAAALLGAIGGSEAVTMLARQLNDPAPAVRQAASRGLGELAYWPSAVALLPLLGDPTFPVRRETAAALTAMGASGQAVLRSALTGPDRFAADIARQALGAAAEGA